MGPGAPRVTARLPVLTRRPLRMLSPEFGAVGALTWAWGLKPW
jgi:hypothetical protein